ncbi:MAG: hypothetical protein H7832_11000 [Magnetococcus sp. DMHC-6]
MELIDHARIGIVGGGPAGAFTAFFLLDLAKRVGLQIHVDIYEPRNFLLTGPPGCNMCGGVISESLIQLMATHGIQLPPEVILDTLDTYTLHTEAGRVQLHTPTHEMRIATIFRGEGPKGSEKQRPLPWDSFDQFILAIACCKGAHHLPHRVTKLTWDQGRPQIHCEQSKPQTYDLLVGAVGLNGPGIKLFDDLHFGYRPPKTTRAFVGELYYGEEEVKRLLGHAMQVFLLNIPKLKFAAITPKGPYATLVILGDEITPELTERLLQTPQVQQCLPTGWSLPVIPCHCQPKINIGPPHKPYADRVVLVGDCSVSRLYKDGIGAAFHLAKSVAMTAITHGISNQDFKKHYWPACRTMAWDNRLGHLMFTLDKYFLNNHPARVGMLATIRQEQAKHPESLGMLSRALWDTFTGSATYRSIFPRSLHPKVIARMIWEGTKSLFY